jgi:hypothetical protein
MSHAGEGPPGEPNFRQYAEFLKRSFEPAAQDWSHDDLAAMLLQELSYCPIGPDASNDAIAHYRQAQKRAKDAVDKDEGDVHPDLARAVYYVSLARAWIEHGVWITKLTRDDVREGLSYVQGCAWVQSNSKLGTKLAELAGRLTP